MADSPSAARTRASRCPLSLIGSNALALTEGGSVLGRAEARDRRVARDSDALRKIVVGHYPGRIRRRGTAKTRPGRRHRDRGTRRRRAGCAMMAAQRIVGLIVAVPFGKLDTSRADGPGREVCLLAGHLEGEKHTGEHQKARTDYPKCSEHATLELHQTTVIIRRNTW